jgi:hypothetical protein
VPPSWPPNGVQASGRGHPVCREKPVIDGKVDDAEWQGAFSQRALQTVQRTISARQARFWMMWDEENLYIAMRDPLRPGERPIQQHRSRQTGTDLDVIFDDCYEIWVSVDATDPLTGQPNCFTQFIGNFAGGRYDAIHQPAVGNSRTSSYDTTGNRRAASPRRTSGRWSWSSRGPAWERPRGRSTTACVSAR